MILLDTSPLIWLGLGLNLGAAARSAIGEAAVASRILVSVVSAWEIGNLTAKRRLVLEPDGATWFHDVTAPPEFEVIALTAEVAFASTSLPGDFHRDPADRFLVATARVLDVPIVTRDAAILAYADAGHVRVVPC